MREQQAIPPARWDAPRRNRKPGPYPPPCEVFPQPWQRTRGHSPTPRSRRPDQHSSRSRRASQGAGSGSLADGRPSVALLRGRSGSESAECRRSGGPGIEAASSASFDRARSSVSSAGRTDGRSFGLMVSTSRTRPVTAQSRLGISAPDGSTRAIGSGASMTGTGILPAEGGRDLAAPPSIPGPSLLRPGRSQQPLT